MANVDFYAPTIGVANVPMGLTGPGQVEHTADGLVITAKMHSKNAASVFGCLGAIVSFGGGIALMIALGLEPTRGVGRLVIAVIIGGFFASIALGRVLFPPKVTTVTIPWAKVKSLGIEEQRVTFVSKAKPKGQVWFTAPPGFYEELRRASGAP